MSSFSLVLPVLNEVDSLKVLLPKLLTKDCEIIIADNGSTDGSIDYIRSLDGKVKLSKGVGSVVDAILRGVTQASTDKIVIMDSDGSHPVETVDALAMNLEHADLVVGSRYIKYGVSKDTRYNNFISRGLNLLAYGLAPGVKDRVSGFWGAKRELFATPIRDTTKPMLETLVRGKPKVVREVPYTMVIRSTGRTKIGRSFKVYLREFYSLALLYVFRFQRPIKFLTVGAVGVGINLGLLWILTEQFHLWYMASSAVGIFIATVWNYFCNNYWTFGKKDLL